MFPAEPSIPAQTRSGSAQPPQRRANPERGRERGAAEEEEADDPGLAEELQRHVVRLRRHVERRRPAWPMDEHERAGAGPLERMVEERAPRLLPPGPAVVRAEARHATG